LGVYSALFPFFDFIQGKDEKLYVPAVMQDRTVQMVNSGMRFTVCEMALPQAASKKIVGSIWSGNDLLLSRIEIITNSQDMLLSPALLVSKSPCCTEKMLRLLKRNSHSMHCGRPEIQSRFFVTAFDNKSLIAEDPLGVLSVSDAGCKYRFPKYHIIADTLYRFTLACQSALSDTPDRDIQAFQKIRERIAAELGRNKPFIPYIACLDTI
jgi:hypothetical protein